MKFIPTPRETHNLKATNVFECLEMDKV